MLAAFLQTLFQFERIIKMVFNIAFMPTSYQNNVFNSSRDSIFYNILNDWLIYQRKHFFWLSFSSWQEASSKTCNRNDCFSYFLLHAVIILRASFFPQSVLQAFRNVCELNFFRF